MADIKTHLRELGFGFGIYKKMNNEELNVEELSPEEFLKTCRYHIDGASDLTKSSISKSKNQNEFSDEEKQIIKNAIKLAEEVIGINQIADEINLKHSQLKIKWLGKDTQSGNPWDIEVNGVLFSLKENSFILQNMGLYQLLNVLTGTCQYQRGLHVFEFFAMNKLKDWFKVTRSLIIENLKNNFYTYENKIKTKTGKLKYNENEDTLYLEFEYNSVSKTETIPNFSKCDYCDFINITSSKVREHTFSKFINDKLKDNDDYNKAKKECAKEAGENIKKLLCKKLKKDLSNSSMENFFRFFDKSYYYAKISDNGNVEIYKVPSKEEIKTKKFKIKDVSYTIPKSQLNLITKIVNENNDKDKIIIRNELRYSHGQFNGTPEAKMYIDKDSSLSVIYEDMKK